MEKLRKFQWHIFSVISSVIAIALIAILFPIYSLYTSAQVREDAEKILIESAEKYGLPKSDFSFAIAKKDYLKLCRRPHQKGRDSLMCDEFFISDALNIK